MPRGQVRESPVPGGFYCICAILLHFCVAGQGNAQLPDPKLRWHTVHAPNFSVHYHEPLGGMAQRVAGICERVNKRLTGHLELGSSSPTEVILTDLTLAANGSATVSPRKTLRLFAQPPPDISALGDYDDWLSVLITHETAHLHHLSEVGGIPAFINRVLGPTIIPNGLLPGWFVEGLATYEESRLSSGGRLRSSLFEMYLRMHVLADRQPNLSQLTHDPIRFPYGDIRYLYGSRFIAYIARQHGESALTQMAQMHGRQAVPYGLNRIAKRVTGKSLVELYVEFSRELRTKFATLNRKLRREGIVEGTSLVAPRNVIRSPRFLPDGRLVYVQDDGFNNTQVRNLSGDISFRVTNHASLAPHPDGTRLLLSMAAPHRDVYRFNDLFEYDLSEGRLTRLTVGLRAREPDISPDGKSLVFISHGAGTATLEVASLHDIANTRRTLFTAKPYESLFTPRYAPDGRTIAVSAQRSGGLRDILLVGVDGQLVREVTRDRAMDGGPTWNVDGTQLFFTSDRDGIRNLYRFDLKSGQTLQITRVVGGVFQPTVAPDGRRLAYVNYASQGFGLAHLDLQTIVPRLTKPYADTRPRAQLPDGTSTGTYRVTPYTPWSTLAPGRLGIAMQPGAFGTELELAVHGIDIAAHHKYAAAVSLSVSESPVPRVELAYSYARSALAPTLSAGRRVRPRRDLEVNGLSKRWLEVVYSVGLGVSYNLPGLFSNQQLALGYDLLYRDSAHPFVAEPDPTAPSPIVPALGFFPSVSGSYQYSSVVRLAEDISPSGGIHAQISLGFVHPLLGRSQSAVRLSWSLAKYLRMPWGHGHVLAARYGGGQASGNAGPYGRFSLGGFPVSRPLRDLQELLYSGVANNVYGAAMRGYPIGHVAGGAFHLMQLEYRLPLVSLESGIDTLPFYARRLSGSLFADAGTAFDRKFRVDEVLTSLGAELHGQLVIGYQIELNLRVGAVHGLGPGGIEQAYINFGTPF